MREKEGTRVPPNFWEGETRLAQPVRHLWMDLKREGGGAHVPLPTFEKGEAQVARPVSDISEWIKIKIQLKVREGGDTCPS